MFLSPSPSPFFLSKVNKSMSSNEDKKEEKNSVCYQNIFKSAVKTLEGGDWDILLGAVDILMTSRLIHECGISPY